MSRTDNRRSLGTVTSVSADRFVVELETSSDSFTLVGFDAQHYVARIGSYVLIPLQTEYVVSEVVGLREREEPGNAGTELVENVRGLSSAKFLDVVPIGSLPFRTDEPFKFGVSIYPPLYADALYTQTSDLDRILEVADFKEPHDDYPEATRLKAFDIGTSVVFDDYDVKVRVDEFFGGHAAILGNTGSGKSCTVAAITQAIFEKPDDFAALGASFIFMDTNGEYRQAFERLPAPIGRLYALVAGGVESSLPEATENETVLRFRLPHWFLSAEEWELLLRASEAAQRPVLRSALGLTSLFADDSDELKDLKNHVLASVIGTLWAGSEGAPSAVTRIMGLLRSFSTSELNRTTLKASLRVNYGQLADDGSSLEKILDTYTLEDVTLPEYTNLPFAFENLGGALELAILYEESHGNKRARDYCSSMITRYYAIRDRGSYQFLRPGTDDLERHERSQERFVEALLGLRRRGGGPLRKASQVTIIDMNEIEDEVVQIVSSVVTRLVFERLRRAKQRNAVPVNLVLEEAHRYVSERPTTYAIDATQIFERVAKEGRKYGLFLTLASQRPSELSRTVLSQCANFVIHRIQNPEDLLHVRRMTPFISDAVMSRLPSLPKQHALIFGNSVTVPTTFRVREASPRPRSDDAHIRKIWFANEVIVDGL